MASYRKLGAGRWQVRWVEPGDDGQRAQRSRVVSTAEARDELLREVQRAEDLKRRYEPTAQRSAIPPIGDGMTAFVEDVRRTRAPGTVKNYVEALAAFCDYLADAGLGHATVADLSRDMLTGFYVALDKGRHDRRRSLVTKRRMVEKVESAWKWLFDVEWHAAVPRPKRIDMPKEPAAIVEAPTWEEMDACVMACVSEGPRRLTMLMRYTGLRVGQVLALTWADVDLERRTLKVAPHKGLPGFLQPMSPHLAAELATWGTREGQLVTWRVARVRRELVVSEAWARAGVRESVWRRRPDHAFRRGVVSGLARLGVEREAAELWIGHAVAGVRAHYLDRQAVALRAVADAIPRISGTVVPLRKEIRR